ncbi:DUF2225 domain-containing protein [Tissierella pigra]|uniref:DUF2225 domain-containing protein n=1 Tax=Tissierella pigra TaxID=2607614 RepID=A0A6N7XIW9_9FIRM|nr:DUF2225 domain-containing protein [Tissierella pigra]MBU5425867.1 DUF2225 domain-containing protein [Tissierella pigra]MSU01556.1 DUF2225 domain-containing protein [Tissierella pigra]
MSETNELFDKKVNCPICKREFTTKKVRTSRLRLIKRDEDFLNHYSTENPIKYSVFVCPHCGYGALETRFEDIKPSEIEIIRKNISPKWYKRDFGGIRNLEESIETYKLALLAANLINAKKIEIANICLNLGWLYRLSEKNDEEIRFLTLARDTFIDVYNNESLIGTNMDESKLCYLVGELSRRIGEKDKASSWLRICIELPTTKMNPGLDDMAREQWRLVKEME